jgi:hypothetical protein
MPQNQEIVVGPELSQEFKNFQEFCAENAGQELLYFDVVRSNPVHMDPVTLAFSMRHLVRLSGALMDLLLASLNGDSELELPAVLAAKGIQLDKNHATTLRDVVFAFRDTTDEEPRRNLVRAFQLMAITRNTSNVILSLEESYQPPDEGWTAEDFGNDESLYETVRSIEDPYWIKTEET